MADLLTAVREFDSSQAKRVREYSGILGLPTSTKTVNVPSRNGYVYVRLRDNESEIIQAYNEEVSPVWNLPVIVIRQGAGWRVKGRDIERYSDWGSGAAFLPEHHYQHEFNPLAPGGDVVFVYPQAFIPMLITPSGTNGGPNVVMQAYNFKKDSGDWLQAGITGTQSLLVYKPTDNQARVALVYLNRSTGNPGLLINSGSSVAANITGTHDLLQYIPDLPTTDYEPLAMARLVSGTESIDWANLYDVRQFFGATASGTGDSTNPAGSDTQVQYNQAGVFGASHKYVYDYANNVLIITSSGTPPAVGSNELHLLAQGASPALFLWSASNNSSINGYISSVRYRGTFQVPLAVEQFDELFQLRARGYNGVNVTATQAEILYSAPYTWVSGSHPTEISFWVTPSGSATMQAIGEAREYGWNLESGKTYNIAGSPHKHSFLLPFGVYSHLSPMTVTESNPYAVSIDRTMTLNSWSQMVFVLSTNDASNHWRIRIKKITDGSIVNEISTESISPNVSVLLTDTIFDVPTVGAADIGIYINCTTSGSPGPLYMFGPAFEVSV
jgi:hypothetical protein